MDEDLKAVRQTFINESSDLLQDMETALLSLEENPGDSDIINALFRSAHTIKGSAGIVGLEAIEKFTHSVENLLSKARDGEVTITPDMTELLLNCRDYISSLVSLASDGIEIPPDDMANTGKLLIERLSVFLSGSQPSGGGQPLPPNTPEGCPEDKSSSGIWHISLRFGENVLRDGMDPLSFIAYLKGLGEIINLTAIHNIPSASDFDPESCYLGFEISLKTEFDKKTIEDVFEFVKEDCKIRILPPNSKTEEYVQLINELSDDAVKLGEILVKGGVITESELNEALNIQSKSEKAAPIGEILIQEGIAQPQVVNAALDKQKQVLEHKAKESKTIRVDADKLDSLINMVGELVISSAGVNQHAFRIGDPMLLESMSIMSRLVEDIRETAMQVRMVPIGETFARFQRVIRDISKDSGKEIELIISGGETELDKTVTEKIGDPLMHLVRNSADHGLELPEERIKAGKPSKGTVQLKAYNDAGSIVIEVIDDGRGLNKDKLVAKAIERGMISEGHNLTEREIFALIFAPGFSTAEQVTKLSGRGVGMDVVRRNIEALRGTIELESVLGQGTTVRIRLPLTLAIIDGFMVEVSGSLYILPLDMVVECVEMSQADRLVSENRKYVNLRGEVLPYLRLRDVFGLPVESAKFENIVVVKYAGEKVGLVVDDLIGEVQTVIKTLGNMYKNVINISGATILGDGTVALIIDIPHLVKSVEKNKQSN